MSSFSYGRRYQSRWLAQFFKNAGKDFWVTNGVSQCEALQSGQNFGDTISLFDQIDLEKMFLASNLVAPAKVNFQSVTADLYLTNQSNANARLVIYDIIARRDQKVYTSGGADLTTPYKSLANGTLGGEVQLPGTTPFACPEFTQFYKVLKMTNIQLAQGQSHTHHIHFQPNKTINSILYESGFDMNIKGLTCYTLIQVQGLPCNDGTTTTNVVLNPVRIDAMWEKQYRYSWLSYNGNMFEHESNISNIQTPSIINIGKGEVDTVVSA